jgi:hypothetical protein
MSLIIGKLYAKLRLATVPGGKAIAAVEEAALFDKIFVESRLLFWMTCQAFLRPRQRASISVRGKVRA